MAFALRALFLGLLHVHCGQARVLTEVPSGPLHRVVGQPLLILCKVSGFQDAERKKGFQFLLHLENKPEFNIISTQDPDFSYRMFSDRVQSEEITLEHVTPNAALFTMTRLTVGDEGEFECEALNHEGNYDGVYFAKILVKVIDDTLTVSSTSTALSLEEGDPLILTCQASSNTVQHTHLSVTWYLRMDGEEHAHQIVSLDRDLTLAAGPRFEERYRDRAVRMDKVGAATYRLHLTRVAPSDQGRVYCRAQEWIQDPDRSWYSLVQKDSEGSALKVQAKDTAEVAPASLVVAVSVQQESLQEGQEMALTCTVDRLAPGDLFSVAWLRNGTELARFGATGVLQVGPQYLGRQHLGELTATKTAARVHTLVLRPVGLQDQGGYLCRVWPQLRGPDGGFTQGQPQDSVTKVVHVSASASGLSVRLGADHVAVTEGGTLQLTCSAAGFAGHLSVAWEHESGSGGARAVVGLSPEGVVGAGLDFALRSVGAARPAPDLFTLELNEVLEADAGIYRCTVTERAAQPSGGVDKSHSETQACGVTVTPLEAALTLRLQSRNTQATVGDDVELLCRLKGASVPVTLIWTLRPDGSTSADKLLELSADGAIAWWGSRQRRYQLRVERKGEMELVHTLLIAGATPGEAGRYRCEASVFLEGQHKKIRPSNELAVRVKKPESQLLLSSEAAVEAVVNEDVTVRCSVDKSTPGAAGYAVTWREERSGRTVLASGLQDVVTHGAPVMPGDEQRISMLRREGPSFQLTVRQALVGDSGLYLCEVVEWLQDPNGNWFDLPPAQTNTSVRISETESQLSIRGGGDVNMTAGLSSNFTLPCTITAQSGAASAFQVSWFWRAAGGPTRPLFTAYPNATLRDRGGMGDRLRFLHPEPGLYSLTVSRPVPEDSGLYHCRVEEWLLAPSPRKVGAVQRSQEVSVDVCADLGGHVDAAADARRSTGILYGVVAGLSLLLLLVLGALVRALRRGQSTGAKKEHSYWAERHPLENKPALDKAEEEETS